MVPKLKFEHLSIYTVFKLSSFANMQVDFAPQVSTVLVAHATR